MENDNFEHNFDVSKFEHLNNYNELKTLFLEIEEISFLYFIKCLSLDKLPKYSKESEDSVNKSVSINNHYYLYYYIPIA